MKKNLRVILLLVGATLLLFLGSYSIKYYLNTTSSSMLKKVDSIEYHLGNGNIEIAIRESNSLKLQWDNIEDKWSLFTNHHEIDNITTSLKNTIAFIEFKDVPNSMANLEALRHYIEHIPLMEEVSLRNIL
ncbi:MAG: DUF4363 family protein [Clostridium sp.]|uniref:DUF4363 family protein n=1 Tax=Clostridium sp. TaxID=1506 RepID=UPI002FC8AA24